MAQRRHPLAARELIAGTFDVLHGSWRAVALLLGAVVGLDAIGDFLPGWTWLPSAIVYFVGHYLLFEVMLSRIGLSPANGRRRFLRFAGMGVVVLLAVLVAANLFVIPGIIVAARLIAAPAILVGTPRGAFASLGESFAMTDGNTLPIGLALSALLLMALVASAVVSPLVAALGVGFPGPSIFTLANLALVGLSVTVYRQLERQGESLAEVFA